MIRYLLTLVTTLLVTTTQAATLELTANMQHASLEGHLEHFSDASNNVSFEAVRQQTFTLLPRFRSLGYGPDAHWFRFTVREPEAEQPTRWVLNVGNPELEQVDIWVEQPDGDFAQYALGYHRLYTDRPYQNRLFSVPVDSHAHGTQVYLRVKTHNAINVNAELQRPGFFVTKQTRDNFHAGLYFGILLIAMLLYSILGAWLRDLVMAAYAGYIGSLVLFNLGVTGYLPVLFGSPWLVDALPRIGWLGGAIAIVLMWGQLLELKRHYPLVQRLYQFTIALNLCLLPFALMPSLVTAQLLIVVKLANYLNSLNFFIGMALVLLSWWRSRRIELMVYFVAFIIPALATLVNTLANQGRLPQTLLTSNLYQLAPLVHVLVMSIGLALRLRQVQRDKAQAEQSVALAAQRAVEQRRFVAMLSHEFRNPLAAIDRSAQMIGVKRPELAALEDQRLGQIRDNVATLATLVDNFLLSEALDHGGLTPSPQPCAIRSLLEGSLQMLGKGAGKRVVLTVIPASATFALDSRLMGMALGNLLDNALRYSPPDSAVEVCATLSEGGLSIHIADRGPAMSEEELAMLGTPYYRSGSSLGKKGSGLGYCFARHIIEAHGGRLQASTRDGGGMTAEIRLA